MAKKNQLPVLFQTENLYHTDNIDASTHQILSIRTYYETMWIERGLNIKYIKFCLPRTGQMIEPDEKIPFDEYRSYHRT